MEDLNYVPKRRPNPRKNANILSILTFLYTVPTFIEGFKKKLLPEDLYETLPDLKSEQLGALASKLWSEEMLATKKNGKKPSLIKVLIKIFIWQYLLLLIVAGVIQFIIQIFIPISLGQMIFAYDDTSSTKEMYVYATYLILYSFLNTIVPNVYDLETTTLDLKMQVVCSRLIYQKLLKVNLSVLKKTTSGQIINLLSNDANSFYTFVVYSHSFFTAPIEGILIFYLSYREIGIPAIFGLFFILCLLPLQYIFGKFISKYRLKTLQERDDRLRIMNEIVQGIDAIKMYVWEKQFQKLVSSFRQREISAVKATTYFKGGYNFHTIFTATSLFLTIATSVVLNIPINAKQAFVVTSFFIIFCKTFLVYIPHAIANTQQVKVSLERITTFLLQNEKNTSFVKNTKDYAVSVTKATAKWDESSNENTLTDLTVNIKFGSLTAIIGPVGCGKSSLLHAILHELPLTAGEVSVTGVLSYASQDPWIFSGSIQQNILFGREMDTDRYNEVINCCALEKDLKLFRNGDKSLVGERGAALSGGQKARVNLARAIYREADVYLLDDPLSAVDTHVGKKIFEDCIRRFLKNKTVVLVTHQLQYLKFVDHVLLLKDGCLKIEGSPKVLQQTGFDFACYLKPCEEVLEINKQTENENKNEIIINNDSCSNFDEDQEITLSSKSILFTTFWRYLKACNSIWLVLVSAVCFIGTQIFTSLSFYFVAYWVRTEREVVLNEKQRMMHVYVYCLITIVNILLSILRIVTFVNISVQSSITLHKSMLNSLLHAPVRFFQLNPSGRILNRFAKDLSTVDDILPTSAIISLRIIFNAIGILAVTCIINPWFTIPTACILICFFYLRKIYLATNLNVLRIESISRSPVYNLTNSSLQGLTTIRSSGIERTLIGQFDRFLNDQTSASYLSACTSIALTFWIDCICLLATMFITIYFTQDKGSTGEAIGLAISQMFQLTGQLAWGIKQLTNVESCMVAVERILEYTRIDRENLLETFKPTMSWPKYGKIQFANVYLKYSSTDPYVLKNLNLTIAPQEKIGIVGRTGAGKSSTITALFQLFQTEGLITIDGVNVQAISLHGLRKNISIISQNPVLFSGSIRENLDPFEEYDDEILWKALEEVRLKQVIDKMGSGLLSKVCQNGTNLSVGQRQLICLARAIIRNNKILVLDEATANVDLQTDDIIQETIRKKFSTCTVLTVAHRLKTVMDSDKVLVIDTGKVLEYDHPYVLLQNRNGTFYRMVHETEKTMSQLLINTAKDNYDKNTVIEQNTKL